MHPESQLGHGVFPNPQPPPPGWQPGPQGWGPPPQPGRSRNTVILIAAAVAVLAIVLTVVLVSVTKSGGGDGPPPVSNKPDITALTDSMLLTEAEFPKLDGGKYGPVNTVERDGDDDCLNLARKGDQKAQAETRGESATFIAVLQLRRFKSDLQAWVAKCLPRESGDINFTQVQLAGLPSGLVSFEATRRGAVLVYVVMGYIRGVLVGAEVDMSHTTHPESPQQAQTDVVAIFNRQAAKLNAA